MNIPTIPFGDHEVTHILDEDGSTETTITSYAKGIPKRPVRHKLRFRERVYSTEQAEQKFKEFNEELAKTPTMLDPEWLPKERSKDGDANGYYYVVKCYTLLEY